VIKSLVIGMRDDKELEAMLNELSPFVDAFITDTFDPKTGASGATARPTTGVSAGVWWSWPIGRLCSPAGLTPENVRRAILEVWPAGVDSHTGVEDSSGRKSRENPKVPVRSV
jgi:phosphoribosylanthranilate isomerase